jgi:hypothetical protein
VVEVRPQLIELTAELVIQLGMGRTPCRAEKQLGSRYPGDPAQTAQRHARICSSTLAFSRSRPRFWHLRPMLSAKRSITRNLLLSWKRNHDRRKIPGIVSLLACSRPVKLALCRYRGWPNGRIACGLVCSGTAVTRRFGQARIRTRVRLQSSFPGALSPAA